MAESIELIECPRDAWQGLYDFIPTEYKAEYLAELVRAGFKHIDAVSFARAIEPAFAAGSVAELALLTRMVEGELLEGLALERSPLFEQWLAGERQRFARWQVKALLRLASLLPAGSEDAVDALRRRLALSPFDTQAYVDLIKALQPDTLPRVQSLAVDGRVLFFTLLISLLTGLLFGAVPGVLLSRASLQATLQQGGRGVRGRLSRRMRGALVAAQVAMSLVLLVAAGLQIRSLGRLLAVDPGFDPADVLTLKVTLPEHRYPDDARQAAFYERALADLGAIPGVASAAVVSSVPISDDDMIFSIAVEGRPPAPPEEARSANWYTVSPEYFRTLRIPLVRGRLFTGADAGTSPRVALINETMARRIFPGQDPLGQRLRMGVDSEVVRTIVGVVGDVRHYGLDQPVTMQMYEPCAQRPWSAMTFLLRAAARPDTLAPAARRAIQAIDPGQPVSEVRTLQAIVDQSTAQRRFTLALLTLFALVALVLASVGLYGVVAYSVTQRTHEIGVRMALGAQRREILALVLRQGMGMTLWGLLAGLLGAAALARVMSGLLFGVSARDPMTFATTVLILTVVALGATYLPARRATRVEPTSALRYE